MNCRHCGVQISFEMLDLGVAPPSNAYLSFEQLQGPERFYPLKVMVCESCWLVQTQDYTEAQDLFTEKYAYFSSYTTSWLVHAERYADAVIRRFGLSEQSKVMEVAANDGYLLQYFRAKNIPCFGIEPTFSTASEARKRGIEILEAFFDEDFSIQLFQSREKVDLVVANNVLAHVPDINKFVAGFRHALLPKGIVTFEFPHLLQLLSKVQFDTVYHEHYSYLSLTVVSRILESQGLKVFDVEELPTHGGSLRIYAQLTQTMPYDTTPRVAQVLERESIANLNTRLPYEAFAKKALNLKLQFLAAIVAAKQQGKRIAAYGAAAKGSTLLNYAGVRSDLIDYVVDRNPHKQGQYLPGSRIPIVAEFSTPHPDVVIILPWNIKGEIIAQLSPILHPAPEYWTCHDVAEGDK